MNWGGSSRLDEPSMTSRFSLDVSLCTARNCRYILPVKPCYFFNEVKPSKLEILVTNDEYPNYESKINLEATT